MPFEVMECRCPRINMPDWWSDPNVPGVKFGEDLVSLNKAMCDLLKDRQILVLLDRKGNAIGFRTPQEGEESGAYTLSSPKKKDKPNVAKSTGGIICCSKRLKQAFPWVKNGLAMKAELVENGHAAMLVVRNKL